MSLPDEFSRAVRARLKDDADLRAALLAEAADALLSGDIGIAHMLIADLIEATLGAADLSTAIGLDVERLDRRLGLDGGVRAGEVLTILTYLQKAFGVRLTVTPAS